MSKYEKTVVQFYYEDDPVPKSGYVQCVIGGIAEIRIEHGEMHGVVVSVNESDIIDDTYDEYDTSDQKLYAWYEGD